MRKKSVKYILEVSKINRERKVFKVKNRFRQFYAGGTMKKGIEREKRVSALIDKMVNSMSPDTLERIEKCSLINKEEKEYRVFYSSGENV